MSYHLKDATRHIIDALKVNPMKIGTLCRGRPFPVTLSDLRDALIVLGEAGVVVKDGNDYRLTCPGSHHTENQQT